MKKLNVSEASNVIGGTTASCAVTFEMETTGTGTSAVSVCRKVTTCNGKYGEIVTRTPADLSSCT